MIPINEKDVLNFKNTINKHPDNTELDVWLSWIHYPIQLSLEEMAEKERDVDNLEFELSTLESTIFLSLKKEDYATKRAMKAVVSGREDVKSLKRQIEKSKYELKISEMKNGKYKNRNRTVHMLSSNRSKTSNFQENIDWTVRKKMGGNNDTKNYRRST